MFESDIPREIKLKTHLAKIRSVLETSGCSTDGRKKLDKPFVIGLTGKTCSHADSFIKSESSKLKSVLEVLSESSSPICIMDAEKEANKLYIELLEASIDDIDEREGRELRSPRVLPLSIEQCKGT